MLLIHVGKCGGWNITSKFRKNGININSLHVHNKNILERINKINNSKIICLLLRDPVKRFISIFNFWKILYNEYKIKKNVLINI